MTTRSSRQELLPQGNRAHQVRDPPELLPEVVPAGADRHPPEHLRRPGRRPVYARRPGQPRHGRPRLCPRRLPDDTTPAAAAALDRPLRTRPRRLPCHLACTGDGAGCSVTPGGGAKRRPGKKTRDEMYLRLTPAKSSSRTSRETGDGAYDWEWRSRAISDGRKSTPEA